MRPSALQALFDSVQAFVASRQNAVLAVLQGETPELQRHYPVTGPLQFAGGRWRAFYHSHPSPRPAAWEHGHFHIFFQFAADDWRHVVALGMDDEGQPRDWFMVNRWVTGGAWLVTTDLRDALDALAAGGGGESLVGDWLGAMLACYAGSLVALASQRDTNLTGIMATTGEQDILDNRHVYELAQQAIDLVADLGRDASAMSS